MNPSDRNLGGASGVARPSPSAEIVRGPVAPDDLEWVNGMLLQSQKLAVLGRLAAGIAHDFNNLLTVIIGVSDLRAESLAKGDPVRADLEEIRGAGERAARLTRQLLNFTRNSKVEPSVIDAAAQIRETEKMLKRLIGEDIVFVSSVHASNPLVFLDPVQLDVVLLNLVINARDSMPNGGRLTIDCSNVSGTSGDWFEIRIQDTGVGMSEDTKKRIFQPFFTTKEPGRGTGLGLTACHGIVTGAGGTIRVESEPGRGTVFTVGFPSCEVGSREADPGGVPVDGQPQGAGETVMLVEDDANVRRVCEATLTQHGYRVLSAESGSEALAIAERHEGPIDLLVSDIIMQGMSGRSLFDRLRLLHSGMRSLFISGYNDEVLMRGSSGPVEGQLLRKPFAPAKLALRVREALTGRD